MQAIVDTSVMPPTRITPCCREASRGDPTRYISMATHIIRIYRPARTPRHTHPPRALLVLPSTPPGGSPPHLRGLQFMPRAFRNLGNGHLLGRVHAPRQFLSPRVLLWPLPRIIIKERQHCVQTPEPLSLRRLPVQWQSRTTLVTTLPTTRSPPDLCSLVRIPNRVILLLPKFRGLPSSVRPVTPRPQERRNMDAGCVTKALTDPVLCERFAHSKPFFSHVISLSICFVTASPRTYRRKRQDSRPLISETNLTAISA
jgi:hypothetical protein